MLNIIEWKLRNERRRNSNCHYKQPTGIFSLNVCLFKIRCFETFEPINLSVGHRASPVQINYDEILFAQFPLNCFVSLYLLGHVTNFFSLSVFLVAQKQNKSKWERTSTAKWTRRIFWLLNYFEIGKSARLFWNCHLNEFFCKGRGWKRNARHCDDGYTTSAIMLLSITPKLFI